MDGAHDLGGMHGFGPVISEGPTEPPFHESWEGRVHGMMVTLIAGRNRGVGSFRYAIEQMGNERYLSTSYYEHWLDGLERLLTAGSVIEAGAVDGRISSGRVSVARREDAALAAKARALLTTPLGRSWAGPEPRFVVGQRVLVRKGELSHAGHTRCPRYVRGALGVIERLLPAEPLPEGLPEGRLEPVPCYTVAFAATDLWGPESEAFTVTVDLVEPYLEEVS